MFAAQAQAPSSNPLNPNNDVEVQCPPDADGFSSLTFSPTSNFFVATNWNNNSYIWEYNQQLQTQGKAQNAGSQPVLCSAWRPDGGAVFLGGCDKGVRLWDLGSNQAQQIAQHDAPVRHCFYLNSLNLLVSAGWDKTFRYWDMRQAKPAHVQTLSERIIAMDVKDDCMVMATTDRQIHVYDAKTAQPAKPPFPTLLKMQVRCVSVFPDKQGFLSASIEGRVAVTNFNETPLAKNFTFKCHRDNLEAYSVNVLSFFPQHGTFVTAGSDGTYSFWDKDSKQRLKALHKVLYGPTTPAPIACGGVDRTHSVFGYAVSYDWSKGYAEYNPAVMKNYILLHACKEEDVKPKPKAAVRK